MNESDLTRVLQQNPDFAGVGESSLNALVGAGVVREPAPGAEIIRQGEVSPQIWVLVEGDLEVIIDGESVNRVSRPGEVVGQISAVSHVPATATVRVGASARCLSVSLQSLHELFGAHPDLAAGMLRSMAKYLGAK